MKKTVFLIKPDNVTDHIQPSLGLGYLATALCGNHNVYILDFLKDNINLSKFKELIIKHNPDIIGFQCYTFDIFIVKKYLKFIKTINSNITLILGGPHPTTSPENTFEFFGDLIDYIFLSESEYSLKKFCDGEPAENIQGIGYRTDAGQINYSYPELENNLDNFGMPAYDLIKPETFPPAQHGAFYEKFPIAPIMTTRGCPFQCTFCAGPIIMGKQVRKKSPDFIIQEIQYLYKHHGIREFHIIDDNFTLDKSFVIELLTKLDKLNLDINWATPNGVRMDTLNEEILTLMKKTGLYLISLGIESGSDRILKELFSTFAKNLLYITTIENLTIGDKSAIL